MATDPNRTIGTGLPTVPSMTQRVRRFLWVFSITMILTAGSAFVLKLIEFFHVATTEGSDALGSFLIPVLTYLTVAAGFGCLFFWSYLRGQYRDVEAPKFRMLEMQAEFDALDARARGAR